MNRGALAWSIVTTSEEVRKALDVQARPREGCIVMEGSQGPIVP